MKNLTESNLSLLTNELGKSQYVLLGEASHGTSEYYVWRAKISQKLIQDHGFSFVAVEGDWPDCYRINQYVKGVNTYGNNAFEVLQNFTRWPTWMWANWEMVAFIEWLKQFNISRKNTSKVGFYGLDIYSLWESLEEIRLYLRNKHPELLEILQEVYQCFAPYHDDAQKYALSTFQFPAGCRDEVIEVLTQLRARKNVLQESDPESYFNASQNAGVLKNAEHYYRLMIQGGPDSWNLRDTHMCETFDRLLKHHGPGAKGIIWAHNTHVGDARATDMYDNNMYNIGQIIREQKGQEKVSVVGFGGYQGSVIAGKSWDAPMERMSVPPALENSLEFHLHTYGKSQFFFKTSEEVSHKLSGWHGHRAIGVVYDPALESYGNYVPTHLPGRYDWFIFFDKTTSLRPIKGIHETPEQTPPDTYPWGI